MNEETKKHIIKGFTKNVRADARKCDEFRDIKVEYGVTRNAEGSAKVTIGDTIVIAGVKISLETPYPDTPDKGNFMVNVELLPLSNPKYESGPPSITAIELARVTDRGIRESKAIDTAKLCIKKGEKVWGVIVDICPINDAGNMFDACSLATIAALKDAKFPKLTEKDGSYSIDYHDRTDKAIPITKTPIGITVWKIEDIIFVDPLTEEQDVFDARLTISSGKDGTIYALQKGGIGTLSAEDINNMVDLGIKKAKELIKFL